MTLTPAQMSLRPNHNQGIIVQELVQLRDAWLGVGAKRSSHISSDAAHAQSGHTAGDRGGIYRERFAPTRAR
jgi:hypothetical protein